MQRKTIYLNILDYITVYNGTVSAEEVFNHWQTREVLSQIVNSSLINSLNLPYRNKSNNHYIYQYELFDDATKKFFKHFKRDIQNVNNGTLPTLPIRKFRNKVGKNNFNLFAQTANFCINDNNITPSSIFANSTSYVTDSKSYSPNKYSEFGNTIVEKMKAKATKMEEHATKMERRASKRQAFLEKTKAIASMDILNIGKSIESKMHNKQKNISNEPTR